MYLPEHTYVISQCATYSCYSTWEFFNLSIHFSSFPHTVSCTARATSIINSNVDQSRSAIIIEWPRTGFPSINSAADALLFWNHELRAYARAHLSSVNFLRGIFFYTKSERLLTRWDVGYLMCKFDRNHGVITRGLAVMIRIIFVAQWVSKVFFLLSCVCFEVNLINHGFNDFFFFKNLDPDKDGWSQD